MQVLHEINVSIRIETSVVDITCDWAIQVFTKSIDVVVLITTKVLRFIRVINLQVLIQTYLASICILQKQDEKDDLLEEYEKKTIPNMLGVFMSA
jgi:hypothetical protein